MGYDLGAVFYGQALAKRMMDERLYGKEEEPKKKNRLKNLMKKLVK